MSRSSSRRFRRLVLARISSSNRPLQPLRRDRPARPMAHSELRGRLVGKPWKSRENIPLRLLPRRGPGPECSADIPSLRTFGFSLRRRSYGLDGSAGGVRKRPYLLVRCENFASVPFAARCRLISFSCCFRYATRESIPPASRLFAAVQRLRTIKAASG